MDRILIGCRYENAMREKSRKAAKDKIEDIIDQRFGADEDDDIELGLAALKLIPAEAKYEGVPARMFVVEAARTYDPRRDDIDRWPPLIRNAVHALRNRLDLIADRPSSDRFISVTLRPQGVRKSLQQKIAKEYGVTPRYVARCHAEYRIFLKEMEAEKEEDV